MRIIEESGLYETRDGRQVEINEFGSFAYGRFVGTSEDDFWVLEDGSYASLAPGAADPRDIVKRLDPPVKVREP